MNRFKIENELKLKNAKQRKKSKMLNKDQNSQAKSKTNKTKQTPFCCQKLGVKKTHRTLNPFQRHFKICPKK